jgi:signal transduction histidine kinase
MYRRLIILSLIIFASLGALSLLGYHALGKWTQGMAGARLGEYVKIAEQLRQDINERLDSFLQIEQDRPYTDYLYYHVPELGQAQQQQAQVLLRSPLGGSLEHELAYGHFQIEPDGTIATPNDRILQREGLSGSNRLVSQELEQLHQNIRSSLLPILSLDKPTDVKPKRVQPSEQQEVYQVAQAYQESVSNTKMQLAQRNRSKDQTQQTQALQIDSLQNQIGEARLLQQQRGVITNNFYSNSETPQEDRAPERSADEVAKRTLAGNATSPPAPPSLDQVQLLMKETQLDQSPAGSMTEQGATRPARSYRSADALIKGLDEILPTAQMQSPADVVQIRIERLVPVLAPTKAKASSIFGGQVFMLRHVQIENRHVLQGFRLNEEKLIEQIKKSAQQIISAHQGLAIELSGQHQENHAFASVLDFGFGDLVLNLMETNPGWMSDRVNWLRKWYLGTTGVVLATVILGLMSLAHGIDQQVQLSRKKDDFISAVSHELRTPLTSIRMYAEMLEKGWVKTNDKRMHYYRNVRQESERLSRLIENVLDFSRIQRGKKTYSFEVGDINDCIQHTIDMIRPHAQQEGFCIQADLQQQASLIFDRDAVTQIVINLLDNAIKYAHQSSDKTIHVRTANHDDYCLIEVQDHGPGIALQQRKKIFDPFYRAEAEATRETTGTGLGLALVKRLAEAHNGFVKIAGVPSEGAIFRVGLARDLEA